MKFFVNNAQWSSPITSPRHPFLRIGLPKFVPSHLGVYPSCYIELARDTNQTGRSKSNLDYYSNKIVHCESLSQSFFVNNAQWSCPSTSPRQPFLRIAVCSFPKFVPSHFGVHPLCYIGLARDTSQTLISPNAIWTTTVKKNSPLWSSKSKFKNFLSLVNNAQWSSLSTSPRHPFLRIAVCSFPKFDPSYFGVHPLSYIQLALDTSQTMISPKAIWTTTLIK